MDELDELLSTTLKRVAQPGDPAGVADAIRSRLDAGDTGTPASSSGFGGGPLSWLPWIGLVVVAGVAGGALGSSGVLGTADADDRPSILSTGSIDRTVVALGCPAGSAAVSLDPGQRVLAIERTEDSAWLGVRNPLDLSRTVWLPVGVVILDDAEPAVDSLPVGGCPRPTVAEPQPGPAPEPVPPPAPEPQPGPAPAPPPPPGDTAAPAILQAGGSPNPFYNDQTVTITALAGDNVGVTSVPISWSGAVSGSGSMTLVGSEWRFSFSTTAQSFGPVTFTMVALDAAGNQSTPVQVVVSHNYFG